jgi:hypothetical protein
MSDTFSASTAGTPYSGVVGTSASDSGGTSPLPATIQRSTVTIEETDLADSAVLTLELNAPDVLVGDVIVLDEDNNPFPVTVDESAVYVAGMRCVQSGTLQVDIVVAAVWGADAPPENILPETSFGIVIYRNSQGILVV